MIEHAPDCRPEHMTPPDEQGIRDCTNCGLWESAPKPRRPGVFDLRRLLGRAPTVQEYRDSDPTRFSGS